MPAVSPYPTLLSPGKIGTMTVRNRIVMAPLVVHFGTDAGAVSPVTTAYLAERAKGGTGLIIVEATSVDLGGRAFPCGLGIHHDSLVPSHVALVEAVHRFGARIALQLHHGGSRADPRFTGGDIVAPSPVPSDGVTPRGLTLTEIPAIVQRFGGAAERARRAGYDAVEIHGAHGYLLHQFLSPAANRRTDAYGGTPERRLRFTLEVIASVRQAVGRDFPVIYRLSCEGGYGIEDAVAFAREWEAAGVDALHVSIGGTAPVPLRAPETSPMAVPQGYMVDHAHAIKRAVGIPVIAVGEIKEPGFADGVLSAGKADFIALGRQLFCDPEWGTKAAQGRPDDILKCIGCDYCRERLNLDLPVRCLINPRLGRETWLGPPEPASTPRRVMVVGGGPAGMETARVAAVRGHRVTLYEAANSLGGGQLTLAQTPPFKERLGWLREHLARQLARLPVEVHLATTATAETVRMESPDVLVVATGATPAIPDIPGVEGRNVITAFRLLASDTPPSAKGVAVLGGRQVGCETAEYLVHHGNEVTVVTRSPASELAADAVQTYRSALLRRLDRAGVRVLDGWDVREIRPDGLALVARDGAERFLNADLVVIARGAVPARALAEEAAELVAEVHVLGDSREPRTIAEAMYEGTLLGRDL